MMSLGKFSAVSAKVTSWVLWYKILLLCPSYSPKILLYIFRQLMKTATLHVFLFKNTPVSARRVAEVLRNECTVYLSAFSSFKNFAIFEEILAKMFLPTGWCTHFPFWYRRKNLVTAQFLTEVFIVTVNCKASWKMVFWIPYFHKEEVFLVHNIIYRHLAQFVFTSCTCYSLYCYHLQK